MEQSIEGYIEAIEFGEAQVYRGMAAIPLFAPGDGILHYLTLKAALEAGVLIVTEVNEGGSVPELMAKNTGDLPILLLDGEELAGAKQNRVLNTTILLREKSETVIPVSCTEHGRWHYRTGEFHDSDVIMARTVRASKARTVSDSLRNERSYRSDQGQVWDDIAHMSSKIGVNSETGAMRDVYLSQEEDLDKYMRAFTLVDKQKGLLVLMGGKVVGFDVVSLESAYAGLHGKLVKSYAMDILAGGGRRVSGKDHHKTGRLFLEEILSCRQESYRSVGHGTDYRFEGPSAVGSALVAYEKVVHMAFFKAGQAERTGRMSGSGQRRGNRMR